MRERAFTAGLLAIAMSGAAGAQGQKPADDAHKTVTVTGCLEASASLPGFRLKDVQLGVDESTPTPAVGTSGKTLTYEVTAKEGVDLSAHAGRTVTVVAEREAQAEKQERAQEASAGNGPLPKLTILSLKTVAATCQPTSP